MCYVADIKYYKILIQDFFYFYAIFIKWSMQVRTCAYVCGIFLHFDLFCRKYIRNMSDPIDNFRVECYC